MSRIGNAPVALPNGVEVTISDRTVTVKGPKGTLSRAIPGEIQIEQAEGSLVFTRPDDDRDNRAKHGLTRSLVNNMVIGSPTASARSLRSSASATAPRRRVRTPFASTSVSATR